MKIRLEVKLTFARGKAERVKPKWPSYCRMCMRRDGKDPYKEQDCLRSETCEHYPFKGLYTPPPE